MVNVKDLKALAGQVKAHPYTPTAIRIIRFGLLAAVLTVLINKVAAIGWDEVADNLPTGSTFYTLFALTYFAQPLGEFLTYRLIWALRPVAYLTVFLRKRVFNFAVFGYSGEAYLYLWARNEPRLRGRDLLSNMKDNMILSALTSNTMTVLMVAFFLATGQMQRFFQRAPDTMIYFALAGLLAVLLVAVVLRFRSAIFELPRKTILQVLSIHSCRMLAILVLQSMMWSSVLPQVPLQTWLVLITAQLVLTRIPFLPNQDLMFLGLVMAMSGFVEAQESAVAGLFLTIGALNQLIHLVLFVATSFGVSGRQPSLPAGAAKA